MHHCFAFASLTQSLIIMTVPCLYFIYLQVLQIFVLNLVLYTVWGMFKRQIRSPQSRRNSPSLLGWFVCAWCWSSSTWPGSYSHSDITARLGVFRYHYQSTRLGVFRYHQQVMGVQASDITSKSGVFRYQCQARDVGQPHPVWGFSDFSYLLQIRNVQIPLPRLRCSLLISRREVFRYHYQVRSVQI